MTATTFCTQSTIFNGSFVIFLLFVVLTRKQLIILDNADDVINFRPDDIGRITFCV